MFPKQLDDHVGDLARHYSSSGNTQKALHYSELAGQQAVPRSAHTQAINHLTIALELLQSSPDTPERPQRELALLMVLAPVLMEAKGYAAPEVERISARARVLCEQMGDAPQLPSVLRILFGFYVNKGELHTADELADQMVSLADRQSDAVFPASCALYEGSDRLLSWGLRLGSRSYTASPHIIQATPLVLAFYRRS